jgi:hypothetical protein
MTDFVRHAERLERAGVQVLAVSVDEPSERDAVRAFAREFGVSFPVLFADDAVVNAYTVLQHNLFDRRTDLAIPTSFLLDEAGDVVMVYRGETDVETDFAGPGRAARRCRSRAAGCDQGRIATITALGASYAERGLPRASAAGLRARLGCGRALIGAAQQFCRRADSGQEPRIAPRSPAARRPARPIRTTWTWP